MTKNYSYDVISTLGFGNSTRFLEGKSTEVATRIFGAIERGVIAIGLLLHVPYFLTIMETFTYTGPMGEFNQWAADEVIRRKKVRLFNALIESVLTKLGRQSKTGSYAPPVEELDRGCSRNTIGQS